MNIVDFIKRIAADIKAKADAAYWPKSDVTNVDLATVATTGSYNDLEDKPSGGVGSFAYVGTCPTAASTVTKVVTTQTFPTSNGAPLVGTIIAVKFDITNTATAPKLNVNGLGAASIYYNTGVVTSTSGIYGGTANRYVYYMWDGTNWVWLNQGTEANDNTLAYQIRTSGQRLTVATTCYRYRLLFKSADGTKWVPANSSTSTNATSSRTPATAKIDPFGQITYYSYTTALSSGGQPSASYQHQQYSGISIGYSFNNTGAAATMTTMAPIYIKCTPQTDGSAIIDATTPYVQALPSTNDGKIYIFLGIATSATAFELMETHPVYYHDGTALRMWTGPVSASSGVTDVTVGGTSVVTNGVAAVPAIPTVPIISTDISTDGNDDTKTASPKAVKTYVDSAIPSVPVTDVTVGGSSVVSSGTAAIPSIPAAGIPSGGSQGQVLAKSSATDYAVSWVNQSGGETPIETTQPVGGMLPNVIYDIGSLGSSQQVTFTLAAAEDTTKENEWRWSFYNTSTGSGGPIITWPSGLIWENGSSPNVGNNMLYEISVRLISNYMVACYKEYNLAQ